MQRDFSKGIVGLGVVKDARPERFVLVLSSPDRSEIWRTDFFTESELRDIYTKRGLTEAQIEHDMQGARSNPV
jgi:hypothetical protein